MDDELGALISFLRSWGGEGAPYQERGVQLICHQRSRGARAYLHEIHAGLDEEGIAELEEIYGRELPPQLRAFYNAINGVCLFEACLNVYGLVRDFARDVEVRNPFCGQIHVQSFAGLHARWHRFGYFPIGSLALYSRKAVIACNVSDHIIVFDEPSGELVRQYPNVFVAVTMLAAEMGPLWCRDGSMANGEEALDGLILPAGAA